MPYVLTREDSGLVYHCDFSSGIPATLTEVTNGAFSSVTSEILRITTSNAADQCYFTFTSDPGLDSKDKILRCKTRLYAGKTGYLSWLGIVDSASRPSGSITGNSETLKPDIIVEAQHPNNFGKWLNGLVWHSPHPSYNTWYHLDMDWTYGSSTQMYFKRMNADCSAQLTGGAVSSGVTYSNKAWPVFGDTDSTNYTLDVDYDYIQIFESYNITVTGLAAGNAVRLFNSGGSPIKSATESGGTATLDCSADVLFPFSGYITVYEDATYAVEIATYPGSVADDIWGGDEYALGWTPPTPSAPTYSEEILRFVDYEYSRTGGASGEILLDLRGQTYAYSPPIGNHCFDIEFPPPPPEIEWIDPAHLDGRSVSRHKYPNREITLTGQIYGTDKEELSTNISLFWEQLKSRRPILEFKPQDWAEPLYIDLISPPVDYDFSDWFQPWIRNYRMLNVCSNVEVICEAKPWLRGPEEEIVIAKGLGSNDSFELDYSASPPTLTDWTAAVVGGGTVVNNNTDPLWGAECVELNTAGGGADSAQVTDSNFLPVADNSHHFNCRIFVKRVGAGAVSLDVDVECFNAAFGSIATLNLLVGDNPGTSWEDPIELSANRGVINPVGGAAPAFPAGTAYVKRTFRNDSNVASQVLIDQAWFGDTERFDKEWSEAPHGFPHRYENPAKVTIDESEIRGDMKSPMNVYIYIPESHPNPASGGLGDNFPINYAVVGTESGEGLSKMVLKDTQLGAGGGSGVNAQLGCLEQWYVGCPYGAFETVDWPDEQKQYYLVMRASPDNVDTLYTPALWGNTWPYTPTDLETLTTQHFLAQPELLTESAQWWYISGEHPNSGFDGYFDSFPVLEIPFVEIPENQDTTGWTFNLLHYWWPTDADNYIDYLVLFPVENGIVKLNSSAAVGPVTFEGLMVGDDVYSYDRENDASTSVDAKYWGGETPFLVDPLNGSVIVYLTTHWTDEGTYLHQPLTNMTHPLQYMDVKIKYSPLYFLTSER